MKKYFYIFSFTVLGIISQFLVHAIIEIWYVGLLLKDFDTYGLGLSWQTWFIIHHVGAIILLICGITFGFWQGKSWWARLYYEDGRRRK